MIKRAREGGGPALLECKMIRFFGHFEGDAQTYKAKGENDFNRENRDCLKLFTARVTSAGMVSDAEIALIDREVAQHSSMTPSPRPRARRCRPRAIS